MGIPQARAYAKTGCTYALQIVNKIDRRRNESIELYTSERVEMLSEICMHSGIQFRVKVYAMITYD